MAPRPTFVVAERNVGKTTALKALLQRPPYDTMKVCGVLALANDDKTQYTLIDLASKERRLALTTEVKAQWPAVGRFFYDEQAFAWANGLIISSLATAELAVFDEIGRLEVAGGGLAMAFFQALHTAHVQVVAAVRTCLVDEVKEAFAVGEAEILRVGERGDE